MTAFLFAKSRLSWITSTDIHFSCSLILLLRLLRRRSMRITGHLARGLDGALEAAMEVEVVVPLLVAARLAELMM